MTKQQVYHFTDSVYRVPFMLIVGGKAKTALNRFYKDIVGKKPKNETIDTLNSNSNGYFFRDDRDKKYGACIWLCELDLRDTFNLSTLAHEINHFVFYVFNLVGIDLDSDNDEPFCYYHQCIFNTICDAVNERNINA